jgi:hypothetical protein
VATSSPENTTVPMLTRLPEPKPLASSRGFLRWTSPSMARGCAGPVTARRRRLPVSRLIEGLNMQDGMTATNPQTGQKVVLRGGQWTPLAQPNTQPAPQQSAPGVIYGRPKPVDPIAQQRNVVGIQSIPNKKQEIIDSLNYLKSKKVKTKQDKDSIYSLEMVLKNLV